MAQDVAYQRVQAERDRRAALEWPEHLASFAAYLDLYRLRGETLESLHIATRGWNASRAAYASEHGCGISDGHLRLLPH